jgi:hypothetical protein
VSAFRLHLIAPPLLARFPPRLFGSSQNAPATPAYHHPSPLPLPVSSIPPRPRPPCASGSTGCPFAIPFITSSQDLRPYGVPCLVPPSSVLACLESPLFSPYGNSLASPHVPPQIDLGLRAVPRAASRSCIFFLLFFGKSAAVHEGILRVHAFNAFLCSAPRSSVLRPDLDIPHPLLRSRVSLTPRVASPPLSQRRVTYTLARGTRVRQSRRIISASVLDASHSGSYESPLMYKYLLSAQ